MRRARRDPKSMRLKWYREAVIAGDPTAAERLKALGK